MFMNEIGSFCYSYVRNSGTIPGLKTICIYLLTTVKVYIEREDSVNVDIINIIRCVLVEKPD